MSPGPLMAAGHAQATWKPGGEARSPRLHGVDTRGHTDTPILGRSGLRQEECPQPVSMTTSTLLVCHTERTVLQSVVDTRCSPILSSQSGSALASFSGPSSLSPLSRPSLHIGTALLSPPPTFLPFQRFPIETIRCTHYPFAL